MRLQRIMAQPREREPVLEYMRAAIEHGSVRPDLMGIFEEDIRPRFLYPAHAGARRRERRCVPGIKQWRRTRRECSVDRHHAREWLVIDANGVERAIRDRLVRCRDCRYGIADETD